MSRWRCTICGQLEGYCPSHPWSEMRRLATGEAYDIPGETGTRLPALDYLSGSLADVEEL